MNKHDKKNPPNDTTQALAHAEAQLAIAAKTYKETGEIHFGSLLAVCSTATNVKLVYKKTPKQDRPAPTWVEYVLLLNKREIFDFSSARMADNYIALDRDLKKVDLEKVKKLAPDGSYGSVNPVVQTLLGKPKPEKQEKSAAQYLGSALKEIEAAEVLLPDATLEIGSIKGALQKLINDEKNASKSAEKANSIVPVMPPQWLKKLATANDALDQVAINEVVDELCAVLQQGGVAGFPVEVTFTKKSNDLAELVRRHDLIKKYIGQVKKTLGYNFAMPKPPAAPTASTKTPKASPATSSNAMFKPKNVKEIADAVGSKSALGRVVGKSSKHADYWAKVDKFPMDLRPTLMKVFKDKNQTLDLSLIAITK